MEAFPGVQDARREYYRLGACKHQTLNPLSSDGLQVQMKAPVVAVLGGRPLH